MRLWVVIPFRGFARSKSRLAGAIDDASRARLNERLFEHAVRCAVEALGAARVLVVSPDEAVIAAAARLNVHALREPRDAGLNGALELARDAVLAQGAAAVLSLSCDLPLLCAADVTYAAALWSGRDSMLIARDEAGAGTNALMVPADARIPYQMGPGSAARHCDSAARANLRVIEIERLGLNFDLDTPSDLERWRTRAGGQAGAHAFGADLEAF